MANYLCKNCYDLPFSHNTSVTNDDRQTTTDRRTDDSHTISSTVTSVRGA